MKKTTIILFLFAFFAISCGVFRKPETQQKQNPAIFDEGVVINGVRWATRNVDMPGTFAETPESTGMFFQWNRRKAWSATEDEVEDWDSTDAEGTAWYAENDPCPPGWRVPTRDEMQSLFDATLGADWDWSSWSIRNANPFFTFNWNGTDVRGMVFGRAPYQIFLPAVSVRNSSDGRLSRDGSGSYWSSTQSRITNAYHFVFTSNPFGLGDNSRALGQSIRCVAKN